MAGEIPAVHRRYVPGVERTAVSRVVPVVEVAAEALEAGHRLERGLEPLDGVDGPEPAKIVGGHGGQQIEPEVRRRRAVRHHRVRLFLEVVGRQGVVFGADERREEPPGPAGDQPEGSRIPGRERRRPRRRRRHADPSSHRGRPRPEHEHGQRGRPGLGSPPRDSGCRGGGERDPTAHSPVETEEVKAEAGLRLRRRHPLQQPAMRHVHTDERPHDRIAHQPRLVRQHRDRERRLRRSQPEVSAHRAGVAALRNAVPPWDQPGEHRHERGERDRRENEPGPHQGRGGRQRPPDDQCQKGGGRRHRAAQVVHHLPAPDRRERVRHDPRKQLPVTARPSVLAGRGDPIMRRRVLEQLDIGDHSGTREEALEEIVTQQRVLRDPPRQGRLERIHVVDPLARV